MGLLCQKVAADLRNHSKKQLNILVEYPTSQINKNRRKELVRHGRQEYAHASVSSSLPKATGIELEFMGN